MNFEQEIESLNQIISSLDPTSSEFKEAYKKLAPLQVQSMKLYEDMDQWMQKLDLIEADYKKSLAELMN